MIQEIQSNRTRKLNETDRGILFRRPKTKSTILHITQPQTIQGPIRNRPTKLASTAESRTYIPLLANALHAIPTYQEPTDAAQTTRPKARWAETTLQTNGSRRALPTASEIRHRSSIARAEHPRKSKKKKKKTKKVGATGSRRKIRATPQRRDQQEGGEGDGSAGGPHRRGGLRADGRRRRRWRRRGGGFGDWASRTRTLRPDPFEMGEERTGGWDVLYRRRGAGLRDGWPSDRRDGRSRCAGADSGGTLSGPACGCAGAPTGRGRVMLTLCWWKELHTITTHARYK